MINNIDTEIERTAREVAIKKLQDQDIDYKELTDEDFNYLIENRIEILKKDVKRVGLTTAITVALTTLTGGI